jgi:hypothetical protein
MAVAVPSGFTSAERIHGREGDGALALLRYTDGSVRLRHVCHAKAGPRVTAPSLHPLHTVVVEQSGRSTVDNHSFQCGDCDLHGWVRDGRWVSA